MQVQVQALLLLLVVVLVLVLVLVLVALRRVLGCQALWRAVYLVWPQVSLPVFLAVAPAPLAVFQQPQPQEPALWPRLVRQTVP